MKKKAFTLQELLITMGIIGVIAALTLPALVKMKPDESKVKYMKAYNALANLAPEIANDETLFRTIRGADGNLQTAGLLNWESGTVTKDFVDPIYFKEGVYTKALGQRNIGPGGHFKFGYFLSRRLNIAKDFAVSASANHLGSTFTTSDGVQWTVIGCGSKDGHNTNIDCGAGTMYNPEDYPDYRQIIILDTNGDKAPNCIFGDANCTSPDRFVFYVNNYGTVEAADKLGKAFLRNPTKTNEVEQDKAVARTL